MFQYENYNKYGRENIEEKHFSGIGNEYFVLERIYLGYMHILHGCSSKMKKLMVEGKFKGNWKI